MAAQWNRDRQLRATFYNPREKNRWLIYRISEWQNAEGNFRKQKNYRLSEPISLHFPHLPHKYAAESLLLSLSLPCLSPCFVIVPFSIHRLIFLFHRSNRSSPKTPLVQHVFDWPAHCFIKATFLCIKYSWPGKKEVSVPIIKRMRWHWVKFCESDTHCFFWRNDINMYNWGVPHKPCLGEVRFFMSQQKAPSVSNVSTLKFTNVRMIRKLKASNDESRRSCICSAQPCSV